MTGSTPARIWYVAYASNLALDRFRCYLRGGPVPGGSRVYPGCRDPGDPVDTAALSLPGRLVFAGRSTVWGGGIAFHDRAAGDGIVCRGYLVTCQQLADVVAQETRQPPGGPVALRIEESLCAAAGDAHAWGASGLYDTLAVNGDRDGVALVTLTHSDLAAMGTRAPAAAYLRWIVAGLRETHGWDAERIGRYLASMPGAAPRWSAGRIAALGPPQEVDWTTSR